MNKKEIEIIKLEKISYEELQHEFINVSTENYVLEHQNNRLQQELDKKNKIIEEIKKYVKSEGVSYLDFAENRCFCNKNQARYILEKIEELEKGSEE